MNGNTPFAESAAQSVIRPTAKAPALPARALQQRLQQAFDTEPAAPHTGSWPGLAKVAVLIGSSALLWAGIIAVSRALLS